MTGPTPTPPPRAAGAIIALCIVLGIAGGVAERQPTLGFLIGLGIGVAIAVLLWLRDTRRG